ncbi:MAG: ATP-binding cassette domain-containing protein [Planctomycetes bacterium]|nr:ATP-binding cassette domain-containing protein [Planctomycetota bacterium]
MKELFKRLLAHPLLTFEIMVCSLFISILGLASAVYVMNVLNRYVSNGIDATLYTLMAGIIIAITFDYAFKGLRIRLAAAINAEPDARLSEISYEKCANARYGALMQLDGGLRREILAGISVIQQTYTPLNLVNLIDVPFAFLYIGAIAFLNPIICVVVLATASILILSSLSIQFFLNRNMKELSSLTVTQATLVHSLQQGADSIRAFNSAGEVQGKLKEAYEHHAKVREKVQKKQASLSHLSMTLSSLMSVFVIALGASQVLSLEMSIGAMIGANILAGRALMPISRCATMSYQLVVADYHLKLLKNFLEIPSEVDEGLEPEAAPQKLEFKNLSFSFASLPNPLFSNLSLALPAGSFVVISGANGTGKSTLAKMLVGLYAPNRGQLLLDNTDLRQYKQSWWRKQLIYLPQEPSFYEGSLRENLVSLRPEAEDEEIRKALSQVQLNHFIDRSVDGLNMPMRESGSHIALGIRRRLALARALIGGGSIVLFDEPAEGMDAEGSRAVFALIQQFRMEKKTIVLCSSRPPNAFPNADIVINLNKNPIPEILKGPFRGKEGQDA